MKSTLEWAAALTVAANVVVVALLSAGVIRPSVSVVVVILAQCAVVVWAGVAMALLKINDDLAARLNSALGRGGILPGISRPHAICGWCEFIGRPLEVLRHENTVHGA